MSDEREITARSAARGVGNLAQFLRRYGAAVMLMVSILSPAASFYLTRTFVSTEAFTAAIDKVTHLVYDRTRPISERVDSLQAELTGIEAKLDAASALQNERARREESDNTEIKADLREIRTALLGPRNGSADARTGR